VARAVRDWEGVCELDARVGLDVGELVAEGSAGGSGDSEACGERVAAEVGEAWALGDGLPEALSEAEALLLPVSLLLLVSLPVPVQEAVALALPVLDPLPVPEELGHPGLTLTEADTRVALAVGDTALGETDGVAATVDVAVACRVGCRGVFELLFEGGGVLDEEGVGLTEFVGEIVGFALLVRLGLELTLIVALLAPAAVNTHTHPRR